MSHRVSVLRSLALWKGRRARPLQQGSSLNHTCEICVSTKPKAKRETIEQFFKSWGVKQRIQKDRRALPELIEELSKKVVEAASRLQANLCRQLAINAEQPVTVLAQVKQLGRYPKRSKSPGTDKECAEDALAQKLSKQNSKLDDAIKAELTRFHKETKGKDAEAQAQPLPQTQQDSRD